MTTKKLPEELREKMELKSVDSGAGANFATQLLIALYNLHRGKVGAFIIVESAQKHLGGPLTKALTNDEGDEEAVELNTVCSAPLLEACGL